MTTLIWNFLVCLGVVTFVLLLLALVAAAFVSYKPRRYEQKRDEDDYYR